MIDPVDKFEGLINGITKDLADGNYVMGAKGLQELAQIWARAGLPQLSFANMRKHLVDTAIQDSDELFIPEKLLSEERNLRNGRRRIIH
jgi:hypothetical protein